ncbi:MAG TPA: response regulator transcription factor [Rectinemataceae bacterium]|nr:response regulator transcription factor [Rectinemataceae bacterium]
MIKVILADDHSVVRRGLKDILEDERDIRVVAEAASGRETIDAALRVKWDAIVMDISMPEMNGFEVLDQLRRHKPKLGVLVLSMHPELQFAVRALEAGAMGYLTKESAPEELVRAVRAIALGRRYISRNLAETLAARLVETGARPLHERLSAREFRVMCLFASGKSTVQIAQALFLSPKTVATYRSRLMDKMGMRSIAEITRYAIENHLID